ncbi:MULTISPECIES: DUF2515 family protein [unclassified Pseudomonas]|uniref:DUF2515 family protein n=1 Tax=unclassified Pseudomonas TaxID=196821 RepID=UPI000A1F2BCE|nr:MULTISPECIES: hypothetical protein [unclassified Pseudomonas]
MTQCFNEHPTDALRLNHPTTPVADCECKEDMLYGERMRVTEVPVLTCQCVWRAYQREAEKIVAPDGVLISDPVQRNRAINAAYARLWMHDSRFQWAGLAAFVSRQVGSGLLHAAGSVEQIRQEHEAQQQCRHVYDMMAMGNTTLFLDVYPLHQFYAVRGLEELKKCLGAREGIYGNIKFPVLWPAGQKTLPFGKAFDQVLKAFEAIEAGNTVASVEHLAWHEQRNILQPSIYENRQLVMLLRSNHFSCVTGFPSGVTQAIELTLTDFGSNPLADLSDIDQRMEFVLRAAARFDQMLNDSNRDAVAQSIREIAMEGA